MLFIFPYYIETEHFAFNQTVRGEGMAVVHRRTVFKALTLSR